MPRLTATALRIALVLVAFLIGTYGFGVAYRMNGLPTDLGAQAFHSLQLIFARFPDALDDKPLPWSLQITRWALPMLTGWATAELLWGELRNPVRRALNRRRGEHLVIAGDGGLAARVAMAARRAGRPITIWAADARDRWVTDAVASGAASVGDAGASEALGLGRAAALLIVGDDDADNLARAQAALDRAAIERDPGDPLQLIVRIDDPDLRGLLEERFGGSGRRGATLRNVSLADLFARALFLARPLDRFAHHPDEQRRLFVIGFSATAERLATRILAGVHYADGSKPKLVIVDPDAELRRGIFFARRPGAGQLAPTLFETARADEPALIDALIAGLIERHGRPNAFLVDPADPARALPVALAIEAYFRARDLPAPPIFARAATGQPELRAAIVPFGALDQLADPEMLTQERTDALARAVHEFYLEGRLDAGDAIGSRNSMREWDDLPEAMRDDNRLVADCWQVKLRDIDARLLDGPGDGLRFGADELEALARAEHDRWMAAKLLDGWTHGDTRDDARLRHPDIVPYEALPETIKELDREQIRIMSRLLGASGRHAARVLTVAVDPAGVSITAGIGEAIAALNARYPDRALILLGDFADPLTRAALAASGEPARLLLAGNGEAVIAAADEPKAARRLLVGADRVYAVARVDCAVLLALADARIASAAAPASDLPGVVVR